MGLRFHRNRKEHKNQTDQRVNCREEHTSKETKSHGT
jgi:hypothetical protein